MSDFNSDVNAKSALTVANEIVLYRRDRFDNLSELAQTQKAYLEGRARMAGVLIEKWGMVAADVDGEDAAGRAKARVLTPSEVVDRACTTADLAYAEFVRRGWVHEISTEFILSASVSDS